MNPNINKRLLRTASKRRPPKIDPSEFHLSGSLNGETANRNVARPATARAGPSRSRRILDLNSSPPSSSALSSPPPLSSSSSAGPSSRPVAPASRSDNPRGGLASNSNVRRFGKKSVTVPTPTEMSSNEEGSGEEEASDEESFEERPNEERQNGDSRRAMPFVEIEQRQPRQQDKNTSSGSEEYRVSRAEMELLRTALEEMRQQNAQLVQRMNKLEEEQVEAQGKADEQHAARAQEQDLRVAEVADYAKDLEADVEALTKRITQLEEGYAEPDAFEAATFTGDAASNDVQDAAPDSSYQPTFGSSRTATSGGW